MKFLFVSEKMTYEWLGVMYVSAALKARGVETRLFIIGSDEQAILEWKPDFIGYSVMTGSHAGYLAFNRQLKKKLAFKSVFGGPHPTYFPEIVNEPGVDYVIRGEAENSVERLLALPADKIIFDPLPQDLDALPFPDRELVYADTPAQRDNPIKHFIASRGCPFDCPYCYNNITAGMYPGQKRVRFRSPENVIEEIRSVVARYPTKFIYFQDDCFDLDKRWLAAFLPLYRKEIGLPFHCMVRLDLLEETTVRMMKDAGLACVRCAVECGNERVRNEVLKRRMTTKQILDGTALLRKYGIGFVLQNMLGLPEGSLSIDLETLRLAMRCRPTLGWASIFQPYPGTELGKRYPSLTIDSINPSFYDDSPFDIPDRTKIRRLQKLFGTVTQHPLLYHFLPLLLRLPLDNVYRALWRRNNRRADRLLYKGIL